MGVVFKGFRKVDARSEEPRETTGRAIFVRPFNAFLTSLFYFPKGPWMPWMHKMIRVTRA